MINIHQRSPGGAQVRSPGGAKNNFYLASKYAGLLGFWPVFGMGKFNATASFTPNNCIPDSTNGNNGSGMDDIWPSVYRTLTVTETDGGGTRTTVTQYQDYCDQPVLVTVSGSCNGNAGWIGSPTITDTTVSQTYSEAGPPFLTGTITATLSNQVNPAALWATWVANALALTSGITIPAADPTCQTYCYYPTSTGNQNSTLDAGYICACAYGMPTRDAVFPPLFSFLSGLPALHAIYDVDSPPSSWGRNFGGIICLSSNWVLGGLPEFVFAGLTDHRTIYIQPFTLALNSDGSLAGTMGSVTAPNPLYAHLNQGSAAATYTNPIPSGQIPLPVTFLASDFALNLPSATYGIQGFRPAPL